MFHREQVGGAINQQLPLNILKARSLIYFSINFFQHKNFYKFYEGKLVDRFFNSVQVSFNFGGEEVKIQGYFELKNYQQTETVEL